MLNDPDYADASAEHQLRQDDEGKKGAVGLRISEYGPVEQRLSTLIGLEKANLFWAQVAAGVKNPPKPKPEKPQMPLVSKLIKQKGDEAGFEIASCFGLGRAAFFASSRN